MRPTLFKHLSVIAAIIIFCWIAIGFGFFQDDAYISFRYVANYLDGHGLVFNIGERVEGYTNFGWVLFLLVGGVLGLDVLLMAKLVGLALVAGLLFLARPLLDKVAPDSSTWLFLIPLTLLASNRSLAYWAQAGLESSAFALLVAAALYLFLKRSWMLIPVLTIAVMVRPEGALVAGLLVLIEFVLYKRKPLYSLVSVGLALLFSLPLVGFKLAYYGSILPNPFFAKTGFDLEQVRSGWDYAVRFFGHYPHLVVGFLVLLLFWKSVPRSGKVVWLFSSAYLIYLITIGGDVLYVHRFFIPLLLPLAIVLTLAIRAVTRRLRRSCQPVMVVIVAASLAYLNLTLPNDFINTYEHREKGLTHKMVFIAERLKESDSSLFSVAASTIGALGYNLPEHHLIDLLGLTDTTIARHPQAPVPGLQSSWRERSFNIPYVLEQAPDYIVFSTGVKPSAPAERALILYPQFQRCYGVVSWSYEPPPDLGSPVGFPVFKQRCRPRPPFDSIFSANLVNNYNDGVNAYSDGDYSRAMAHLDRAISLAGDTPYRYLLYFKSLCLLQLRRFGDGHRLQDYIVMTDSAMYEPQADLYVYEYMVGNVAKAARHRSWLEQLVPWRLPVYDSMAIARARDWKPRRQPPSN